MKAIEMSFTLLGRKNKRVISALIGAAAKDIGENTVHTALRSNN